MSIAEVPSEAIESLLDEAFGEDRRARTSYRIRAGMAAIAPLSFAAVEGERLVGSIQCWPVLLTCDDAVKRPLVMLGPVAVKPVRQRLGIGHLLMDAALEAWQAAGASEPMMLIGDPDYYARLFGFSPARTGRWRLPGPFEPHRLLARGDDVPDCAGLLGPWALAAV